LATDGQTNRRTDGWSIPALVMPPAVSMAWLKHKNNKSHIKSWRLR